MAASSSDNPSLATLRELVAAAFEQAGRRGKDATLMRSAVLKNRLLQITHGEFRELDYGSKSMVEIMASIPDLIQVDGHNPTVFRFLGQQAAPSAPMELRSVAEKPTPKTFDPRSLTSGEWVHARIRDDLWQAVLDYSAEVVRIWDAEENIARPRQVLDAPDMQELPSLSAPTLRGWREGFVEATSAGLDLAAITALRDWADGSGALGNLPRRFRKSWLEHLKRNVALVLVNWFESQNLQLPQDFLTNDSKNNRVVGNPQTEDVVAVRRLRSLVLDAVEVMTLDELQGLSLPVGVFARLDGRR